MGRFHYKPISKNTKTLDPLLYYNTKTHDPLLYYNTKTLDPLLYYIKANNNKGKQLWSSESWIFDETE